MFFPESQWDVEVCTTGSIVAYPLGASQPARHEAPDKDTRGSEDTTNHSI